MQPARILLPAMQGEPVTGSVKRLAGDTDYSGWSGRSERGKVAAALRGRGHEGLHGLGLLMINQPLIDAEDEKRVLADGTARIAAELMLVNYRHREAQRSCGH